MGKGSKKRGGGGGKGKHHKGSGGGKSGRQKDDSPVVAKKKVTGSAFPMPGLMNLGNTCFFNSVMQSIAQSNYLRQHLDHLMMSPRCSLQLTAEEQQLQVTVSEDPGTLTRTLHTFMTEMNTHQGRSLNPRPLFSQICDKAPRFRGFQQQDSQELLRYLLDSLKMEEIHRIKRAILVAFNVSSGKKQAISKLTERDRELIKMFGNRVYHEPTYVDAVFGGSLVSTVTCNECHNCTTIHENYLDLSLSIPKDKGLNRSPGGKQHQLRDRSRDKLQRKEREVAGEEEEEGRREIDNPKAAAVSKYQQKKMRKKERKGKFVKGCLHELENMISEKNEVGECVENGRISEQTAEMVDGEEGRLGVEEEKRKLLEKEDGLNDGGPNVSQVGVCEVDGGRDVGEVGGCGDVGGEDAGEKVGGCKVGGCANVGEVEGGKGDREDKCEEECTIVGEVGCGECEVGGRAGVGGGEKVSGCGESVVEVEHGERGCICEVGGGERGEEEGATSSLTFTPSVDEQSETRAATTDVAQPMKATINKDEFVSTATTAPSSDTKVDQKHVCDGTTTDGLTLPNVSKAGCIVGNRRDVPEETGDAVLPRHPEDTTPNLYDTCSPLNSVVCDEDSIEGCLRKFCSPELLTGSNRFLCSLCTQKKAAQKASMKLKVANSLDVTPESVDVSLRNEITTHEPGVSEDCPPVVEKSQEHENIEEGGVLSSVEKEEDRVKENCVKIEESALEETYDKDGEKGGAEGERGTEEGWKGKDEEVEGEAEEEGGEREEGERGVVNEKRAEESELQPRQPEAEMLEENETKHTRERTKDDSAKSSGGSECDEEDSRSVTGSHYESAKESDDGDGEEQLDSSSDSSPLKKGGPTEELVFSDATKQLLIKSLPPVLTLHLKRFLQEGRRLRKNGRHISFPAVLDMAPYCVTECKSLCDSSGRILYSLYAVVEHAGGMQGGHYTAYVRVRKTDSHTPFTAVGGVSEKMNRVSEGSEVSDEKGCGASSAMEGVATNGVCTKAATTDGHRETMVDHTLTNGVTVPRVTAAKQTVSANQCDTTNDQLPTTANHSGPCTMGDQTVTTANESNTTGNQTETAPTNCGTTLPHTSSQSSNHTPFQTNFEFDLSPASGQWYHISDTHVRTATQTEVEKSQAYILFYERLPFKSS